MGCPAGFAKFRLIYDMKFPEELVLKAIEQTGVEENIELILQNVLLLQDTVNSSVEDRRILALEAMGFSVEEASIAIDRCPEASIAELIEFIAAAQLVKADNVRGQDESKELDRKRPRELKKNKQGPRELKKNKQGPRELKKNKKGPHLPKRNEAIPFPRQMVGFGVPKEGSLVIDRKLLKAAIGPPYFYYENVAQAPEGVWETISRFLYDVKPEFVDSKFFCAVARERGYVHNLPIDKRSLLVPHPPQTIHDAFPTTKKWWPSWDTRTKFKCLRKAASAKQTDKILKALQNYESDPPKSVQKYVLRECTKWNLVWVARNKVAPLECDEVEMLLGYPKHHTRGGGISMTDRHKALDNSFQVDTVAYHLSVLKDIFPGGINVLSLFSGIGGAEVALHRLGIPLKNVVSVEISEVNRTIVKSWWELTNQKGTLIQFADVQKVDSVKLKQWMDSFGCFDLVIGGSPCNNLANGLHSELFYEYVRVLYLVRAVMC